MEEIKNRIEGRDKETEIQRDKETELTMKIPSKAG
jgi:hypothetical protein